MCLCRRGGWEEEEGECRGEMGGRGKREEGGVVGDTTDMDPHAHTTCSSDYILYARKYLRYVIFAN